MRNTTKLYIEKALVGAFVLMLFLNGMLFVRDFSLGYMLLFATGVLAGFALLEFDEWFLYQYYQEVGKPAQLMTRSAVFLLSLFPMSLFIMTSTGSFLGTGMLLGILSGLSVELLAVRSDKQLFESRFAQQIKRPFAANEQWWLCVGFCLLTLVIALLISFTNR